MVAKENASHGLRFPISVLHSKIEQATRLFILHFLSGTVKIYLVTEYPKSGGTWLGQLISGYLQIPFPRNRIPKLQQSLFHGHYLPSKHFNRLEKIFFLIRDGRDIMVSLYHYYLFWNEKSMKHPKEVLYYRKKLQFKDYSNVQKNLPQFIEFIFTDRPSRFHRFTYMGDWTTYNNRWLEQEEISSDKIVRVRYEDLLKATTTELARIIQHSTNNEPDMQLIRNVVDKYSFEKQTGRRQGEENKGSFLRKGIAGDWKNYFTKEAAEIFDHFAGKTLIKLQYEQNNDWVSHCG
jgi:hypothetical protein